MKKLLFFISLSLFTSTVFSGFSESENLDGTKFYICEDKTCEWMSFRLPDAVTHDLTHELDKNKNKDLPSNNPGKTVKRPPHNAKKTRAESLGGAPQKKLRHSPEPSPRSSADSDSETTSSWDSDDAPTAAQTSKPNSARRSSREERPFACEYCEYRAKQSSHMIAHKRTHTDEKPFKCKFCEYRSNQGGAMRCHERTHTGEKPFKCAICGKKSTTSSNLSRHMRTHTHKK